MADRTQKTTLKEEMYVAYSVPKQREQEIAERTKQEMQKHIAWKQD